MIDNMFPHNIHRIQIIYLGVELMNGGHLQYLRNIVTGETLLHHVGQILRYAVALNGAIVPGLQDIFVPHNLKEEIIRSTIISAPYLNNQAIQIQQIPASGF